MIFTVKHKRPGINKLKTGTDLFLDSGTVLEVICGRLRGREHMFLRDHRRGRLG